MKNRLIIFLLMCSFITDAQCLIDKGLIEIGSIDEISCSYNETDSVINDYLLKLGILRNLISGSLINVDDRKSKQQYFDIETVSKTTNIYNSNVEKGFCHFYDILSKITYTEDVKINVKRIDLQYPIYVDLVSYNIPNVKFTERSNYYYLIKPWNSHSNIFFKESLIPRFYEVEVDSSIMHLINKYRNTFDSFGNNKYSTFQMTKKYLVVELPIYTYPNRIGYDIQFLFLSKEFINYKNSVRVLYERIMAYYKKEYPSLKVLSPQHAKSLVFAMIWSEYQPEYIILENTKSSKYYYRIFSKIKNEIVHICFDINTLDVCEVSLKRIKSNKKDEGIISAEYSISKNKKVYFSSGNLQYQLSTHTWKFSDTQEEALGIKNLMATPNNDGWIDQFQWGSSGYNSCFPMSNKSFDFRNCKKNVTDISYYDWGQYNIIDNGGNQKLIWRILNIDEWQYLLFKREDASLKRCFAIVNGVEGLVLFPDNFNMLSKFNLNNSNYNLFSNRVWKILEKKGAVFLPFGGSINAIEQFKIDESKKNKCLLNLLDNHVNGSIWTTSMTNLGCYYLFYDGENIRVMEGNGLRMVRLVKEVN